jgi:CRISPR-associated protein Cas1
VGLEHSVGFLHEFSESQTKESLVYDLQEPFRWLGDVTTIEAFESGALDMKDFYFTGDDYRYHIETEAKRRLMEVLREQFNIGVRCNGRVLKWDTVTEQKTTELARYVSGKSENIEFSQPAPELIRPDNRELRSKIIALSISGARESMIGKSTLHYLRRNAKSVYPFKVHKKVMRRVEKLVSLLREERAS